MLVHSLSQEAVHRDFNFQPNLDHLPMALNFQGLTQPHPPLNYLKSPFPITYLSSQLLLQTIIHLVAYMWHFISLLLSLGWWMGFSEFQPVIWTCTLLWEG